MPEWIHDRQKHIKRKNPDIDESLAWAIATEQAYATDKAPSGYGTKKSRKRSKKKYKKSPDRYEQVGDPKTKRKSKKSRKSFVLRYRMLSAMLEGHFPYEAYSLRNVKMEV